MAKKTKSGLGRGLSSLLGEEVEEETPAKAPAAKKKAPVEPEAAVEEKPQKAAPAKKKPAAKPAAPAAPATEEPAEEKRETPRPYIEVDDHVTIKSVVEREAHQPDEVPINKVKANPDQPRTSFKSEEIEELAASIAKDGLLQPVLVRKVGAGYQIIAGERRWRASKAAGLKNIPVRVVEADDDRMLELGLVENVQRSDLNPIEEAYGYKRMMERKGMTQSDVAVAVSKGRSTVANALRLLELPEDAQQMLFEESITAGHARAILSIPTRSGRQKLTDKLKNEKLSVREAEAIARLFSGKQSSGEGAAKREPAPAYFKAAAKTLKDALKTNVRVKQSKGKNKVEIEFKDERDLERMFAILFPEGD